MEVQRRFWRHIPTIFLSCWKGLWSYSSLYSCTTHTYTQYSKEWAAQNPGDTSFESQIPVYTNQLGWLVLYAPCHLVCVVILWWKCKWAHIPFYVAMYMQMCPTSTICIYVLQLSAISMVLWTGALILPVFLISLMLKSYDVPPFQSSRWHKFSLCLFSRSLTIWKPYPIIAMTNRWLDTARPTNPSM